MKRELSVRNIFIAVVVLFGLAVMNAWGENQAPLAPFKTFITLQRYFVESAGRAGNSTAEIRLELVLPDGRTARLPKNKAYWTFKNHTDKKIQQTFEVPSGISTKGDFSFAVQIVRKGTEYLPCNFTVAQIAEYNRQYICRTDSKSHEDKEGIEVRVFTGRDLPKGVMPAGTVALR